MPKIDKNLLDDFIKAIPTIIDDYIDDRRLEIKRERHAHPESKDSKILLDLVLSLKALANPDKAYPLKLQGADLISLGYITERLANPELLSSDEPMPSRRAIQKVLNRKANQLIYEYNLTQKVNDSMQHYTGEVKTWWANKNQEEKEQIKVQCQNYSNDEKLTSHGNSVHITNVNVNVNEDRFSNLFYLYQLNKLINQTQYAYPQPIYRQQYSTNQYHNYSSSGYYSSSLGGTKNVGGYSSSLSNNGAQDKDKPGLFVIITLVTGALSLLVFGTAGAFYALKKSFDALRSLMTGHKILRSLYRLALTGGSGFGGYFIGAAFGASFGSVFPVVGTTLGMLVGGVLGAGLFAGMGAAIGKYSARMIAQATNKQTLNPTNPEKYTLTPKQEKHLLTLNFDLHVLNYMMKAIHREKSRLGIKRSFFWTDEYQENARLNHLLYDLKNYPEVFLNNSPNSPFAFPLQIGKIYYHPRLSVEKQAQQFVSTTGVLKQAFTSEEGQDFSYGSVAPSAPPVEADKSDPIPQDRKVTENIMQDNGPQEDELPCIYPELRGFQR